MFDTINEIEQYFIKRREFGIKPGLERVHKLLKKMGNPEKKLKAIHVAGTNGKGSTIQFLKNALVEQHYEVGLFTSPSFSGLAGHFLINQQQIKEDDIILFMNRLFPSIEKLDEVGMHPTEFEILTVLAFLYFKEKRVDFALIETGMGGREDTTNCFIPILSIITNVEKDHMNFLGNTIEEITLHKAGIMKRHRPIVVGPLHHSSEKIIKREARKLKAPFFQLGKHFFVKEENNRAIWTYNDVTISFKLNMQGFHQVENASLALMALCLLNENGLTINWQTVVTSLQKTTLPGRFEVVSSNPTVIIDSAHNVAGIHSLIQTVQSNYPKQSVHVLFAAFKDKQLDEMLSLLKENVASITLTTFSHDRAASVMELKPLIGENIYLELDWKKAIKKLNEHCQQDIFLVTGSLHFITVVRQYFKR